MEKLFCLPYAGGSSVLYTKLKRYAQGCLEVMPVEYAGHGRRMGEPLCADPDACVEEIYQYICKQAGEDDFSLLGYSLGSALAYGVALRIESDPRLSGRFRSLILCACGAPGAPETLADTEHMTDDEYISYLVSLGGTKVETRAEQRAIRLFLPIVRSDFKLYARCKARHTELDGPALQAGLPLGEERKIHVPMAVFYSEEEKEGISLWDRYAAKPVVYEAFPGGHFFINSHTERFQEAVLRFVKEGAEAGNAALV